MKNIYYILIMCIAAVIIVGCKEDSSVINIENQTLYEMSFSAGYPTQTRVTDTGFSDNDRMGIYVVDYLDGNPQSLSSEKLHASNVRYIYNEAENIWEGATKLYWNDKTTPVDIYGYYPFDNLLTTPTAYSFSVKTNQNTSATNGMKGGYEASDLLRAKAERIEPTAETIMLTYSHLMAGVTIRLEAGEGFSKEEWQDVEKMVWVDNVVSDCVVNLEDGSVTPTEGNTMQIAPFQYNAEYRAVVVPQTVAAGKALVSLVIDGQNYALTKNVSTTYYSGKMHTFTIEVKRRADSGDYEVSVKDAAIVAWLDDEDFHDGLIREYVVANVETPGTLKQVLADMNLDYSKIESMKIVGTINADDRYFIGVEMPVLSSLNASDAIMEDGVFSFDTGVWCGGGHIVHVVYPKSSVKLLGGIGPLIGRQIIPEGVEEINGWFVNRAEVEFPSTLKTIGETGGRMYGELHLPEGLESYWSISGSFTGTLRLPESLKSIGILRGSYNGDLIIPQGIKEIPEFAFRDCSFTGGLVIPEGVEKIGSQSFDNCSFKGELALPLTLTTISHASFINCKITKVLFNDNLFFLGPRAFEGCNRLTGTVTIPPKVTAVPERLYMGCSLITGIELHKDIAYIGDQAFAGCSYVTNIICHAEEPPVFEENTFLGMNLGDIVVEVPAASVPIYQQDDRWKRFKRITAYSNFHCRPSTACALNTAHDQFVTLYADGAWSVSHKPDWCRVSQMSGTGKTVLTISIDEMAHNNGNREDYVEFQIEGKNFTTCCNISQYDYEYKEDELLTLQTHSKGRGIKILFLGDGWDGKDLSDGEFVELCKEEMEHFFGLPPYNRLRDYFDVYAAVSLSQESGVNTIYTYLDTRFETIYAVASNGCDANAYVPDEEVLFSYIDETLNGITSEELRNGLLILVPNSKDYGGITYYTDICPISICPPSENPYPGDTRGTVQHEAGGHGFGKLGDENIVYNMFAPTGVKANVGSMHERGWYMNLATTGKMNEVPWKDYIFDPRYSDNVDIYEGGFNYTRGIFRSESNSCMNYGIPYYNAISREYITRRVMDAAGVPFSMEEFYENDSKAWGTTTSGTRAGDCEKYHGIINHCEPVFVKGNELRETLKRLRKKQTENNK